MAFDQEHRRRYPRAREVLPVKLSLGDGKHTFEATVQTVDISLTGVFFASTFFLKAGTELDLQFQMPNDERTVRARGIIVREVRIDEAGGAKTRSGFAMRFTNYYDDAKTVLATSFLVAQLDEFVHDYLKRRTKKPKSELDSLRDVIVAWEVGKMELKGGELDLMRDSISVDSQGQVKRRR